MAFHELFRFTKDIDILITSESYEGIGFILNDAGYTEKALPWRFANSQLTLHRFTKFEGEECMIVDVMIGDDERHREVLNDCITAESDDGSVMIASKADLIWMKSQRNSEQDQIDIKHLQK